MSGKRELSKEEYDQDERQRASKRPRIMIQREDELDFTDLTTTTSTITHGPMEQGSWRDVKNAKRLPVTWQNLQEDVFDLHSNTAADPNDNNGVEGDIHEGIKHVGYSLWVALTRVLSLEHTLQRFPQNANILLSMLDDMLSDGMYWILDELTGHHGPWTLQELNQVRDQLEETPPPPPLQHPRDLTAEQQLQEERLHPVSEDNSNGGRSHPDGGQRIQRSFYLDREDHFGVTDKQVIQWALGVGGHDVASLIRALEYRYAYTEDPFSEPDMRDVEEHPKLKYLDQDKLDLLRAIRANFGKPTQDADSDNEYVEDVLGISKAVELLLGGGWTPKEILQLYPKDVMVNHLPWMSWMQKEALQQERKELQREELILQRILKIAQQSQQEEYLKQREDADFTDQDIQQALVQQSEVNPITQTSSAVQQESSQEQPPNLFDGSYRQLDNKEVVPIHSSNTNSSYDEPPKDFDSV